jgi:hypothetical protein
MIRALFLLSVPAALLAQDAAHWGVQTDYFKGAVPRGIVERIKDLPEQPDIDAKGYNTGLVRFHANGSPSWAIEFSRTQMTLNGGAVVNGTRQELRADATVRGAMITKYTNFFSNKYVSGGLAFGGGGARVDASYLRYQVSRLGSPVVAQAETTQLLVPVFQAIAQVDIRPVRWISISPFYGLRNGALGAGGAIRIHFTR